VAEVVADQLRRNLGINVSAYNQEWQSYLQSTRSMSYEVARGGWVGDYEDPNTFLDLWITNGGNNQTGWSNLLYDRLLEAAGNVDEFVLAPEFVLERAQKPAELTRLVEGVRNSSDAERRLRAMAELRMALLSEAEGLLMRDELPIIPVYFYVLGGLVRPQVGGFYSKLKGADGQERANLRDIHPLREIFIREAGGP
jgi:oligopeptide transport system substrate-binding protein